MFAIANGLLDGQTIKVLHQQGIFGHSMGLEASERCPQHEVGIFEQRALGWTVETIVTGEYTPTGSTSWYDDVHITVASPEGDAHMKELVLTGWFIPNIPNDPWPTQDTNDPYPSGCP